MRMRNLSILVSGFAAAALAGEPSAVSAATGAGLIAGGDTGRGGAASPGSLLATSVAGSGNIKELRNFS